MSNPTPIQSEDLIALLETNKRLITSGDSKQVLTFILDEAIRISGAERGFIILHEENKLQVAAARHMDREGIQRAQKKFSRTVIDKVMQSGEVLMAMDALEDQELKQAKSVTEMKLRSILCVPLWVIDEPLGVLYLDHRFTAGAFQAAQVRLVRLFADQAALALSTLNALQASQDHAAELQRLQGQLASLNEALQSKLSSAEAEQERMQHLLGQVSVPTQLKGIVGQSKALRDVLKTIRQLRDTEISVYIHGESGTGKELIARSLHQESPRGETSFHALNCSAFSEQILDSELFGHVRGAFTGADRDRRGLFEEASGGTLFLDEVGEMSASMQAKLLRVSQEREIRPVGSNKTIPIDVRILSASNKDLKALVARGTFREDLYYRLNVVRLDLPPLRARSEDIPDLVHHFMQQDTLGIPDEFLAIDPEAMDHLMAYDWPGNIRELQNEIHRALVLGKGHIQTRFLSPELQNAFKPVPVSEVGNLDGSLQAVERQLIIQALEDTNGNKQKAAVVLGISRSKLYQKIQRHGLATDQGQLSPRKIRAALKVTRGNKAAAARRLGITRRTLYQHLNK